MSVLTPATTPAHIDLGSMGDNRCHTVGDDKKPLCGMGSVNPGMVHEYIEPVDGICPTCGLKSCPTCDLMDGMDSVGVLGRKLDALGT